MKKKTAALVLLLSVGGAIAQPTVTMAPVKHLYIPAGFDSNDSIEVVVTGYFPNPCISRNTVLVDVKEEKISITVTALTPNYKSFCPDMAVPFKEVVSIGNLQGGDYDISVNDVLAKTMKVAESSSGAIDDHLYAAIDDLEKVSEKKYVLHGWRYSPCIDLDRVEVRSNGNDTISVLPIMKQVRDWCPMKLTPVAYPVELDLKKLKTTEPLVHVRTMDGKSFNSILNLGTH